MRIDCQHPLCSYIYVYKDGARLPRVQELDTVRRIARTFRGVYAEGRQVHADEPFDELRIWDRAPRPQAEALRDVLAAESNLPVRLGVPEDEI